MTKTLTEFHAQDITGRLRQAAEVMTEDDVNPIVWADTDGPEHEHTSDVLKAAAKQIERVASSRVDCVPWAFGTSLLHQPRLGRTDLPNG
jgi:hypothetical protein